MSSLTSGYLRQAFRLSRPTLVRNYATIGSVKDPILRMYIDSLKTYKPTTKRPDSEAGQVKELILPTAPQPPTVDTNITSELASSYEIEDLPQSEEVLAVESLEEKILTKETYRISY